LRSEDYSKGKKVDGKIHHSHLFVTGIDGIISGNIFAYWCQYCHEKKPLEGQEDKRFVTGPLIWVKENPAYQDVDGGYKRTMITGSFNPLPADDWEENVYIQNENSNQNKTFNCNECGNSFASSNQLNKHTRENHFNQNQPTVKFSSPPIKPTEPEASPYRKPLEPTYMSKSFGDDISLSSFGVQPGQSLSTYSPSKYFTNSNENTNQSTYSSTSSSYYHSATSSSSYVPTPRADFVQNSYNSYSGAYQSPRSHHGGSRSTAAPWQGKEMNTITKCLLLAGLLYREKRIDDQQKGKLKDMIITNQTQIITAAIDAYDLCDDFEDLVDTIQRLTKREIY